MGPKSDSLVFLKGYQKTFCRIALRVERKKVFLEKMRKKARSAGGDPTQPALSPPKRGLGGVLSVGW